MASRWLAGFVSLVVLPVLASCTILGERSEEQPARYDVREAVVLANADVPKALIHGVDRRVGDSIRATVRTEPLPRVVLTVKIEKVEKGIGQKQDRNSASVVARATAVDSGEEIAMTTFRVFNYGSLENADQGLAEEIAARLRHGFALARPPISKTDQVPQAAPPPSDTPSIAFPDAPAADIPTAAAPAAGAGI